MQIQNKNSTNGGIGFVGLLTILFIALKLLKIISWSWWWVLSPIWITTAFVLVIVIPFVIWISSKK